MGIEIRALSLEEEEAFEGGLNLASRITASTRPLTVEKVQELYNALLEDHPDYRDGAIAAGLAFGEVIALRTGYEWVRVINEFGEETCVSPHGKMIYCAPISMIQKRISRSEILDIQLLLDETIQTIRMRAESGEYNAR